MPLRIVRRRRNHDAGTLAAGMHPVLARVLSAREVRAPEDLDYSLQRLLAHHDLSGMDGAIALLRRALAAQWRVLVVGDFDADGATACAVAVRGLTMLGFEHVSYLVPNRFEYGYGLTPEIVAVAARMRPQLLITVDNGISSIEGVRCARASGIEVLVTDHHLPGATLPEASAIVNPNLPGDSFASKNLAGVGVMFYVLVALRAQLRESGHYEHKASVQPNLAQLLDLVALGTVADVVPLDRNNRILIEQGLKRIRHGRCHAGVRALLEVSGRDSALAVASDLSFGAAPRLNAAGRLTDMSLGIECLLCDDDSACREMAARLDALNRERRAIESDMQGDALTALERLALDAEVLPFGLCLFNDEWHQGVIGILAARIKDRFHRPVIAFARGSGAELKGSARSTPGVHIRDALDAIATTHPGLITRFGGHAMAAGLSIERDRFDQFRQIFEAQMCATLNEDDIQGVLYTDGSLQAAEIDLSLAEALRAAGPWGQAFPEPVFDGEFEVLDQRVVADKHLKLRLRAGRTRRTIEAMAFNTDVNACPNGTRRVRIAYRLDVNRYGGNAKAQLVLEHIEPIDV